MIGLRGLLFAAGVIAVSAAPALAINDYSMAEGTIVMFSPTGRIAAGKLNEKGMSSMSAMMKGAKQIPMGTIIFQNKGKLYMVSDPKGAMWGKMLGDIGNF